MEKKSIKRIKPASAENKRLCLRVWKEKGLSVPSKGRFAGKTKWSLWTGSFRFTVEMLFPAMCPLSLSGCNNSHTADDCRFASNMWLHISWWWWKTRKTKRGKLVYILWNSFRIASSIGETLSAKSIIRRNRKFKILALDSGKEMWTTATLVYKTDEIA